MTWQAAQLRPTSHVALVGGTPYHRDMLTGWLTDAAGVLSITPVSDEQHRRPRGTTGTTSLAIDVVVGVLDEGHEQTLADCRRLLEADRARHLVAVLVTPHSRVLQAAVAAGADAVVAAESGQAHLARAVAVAASGGAWLDPALSGMVMQQMGSPMADDLGLTPTQAEVARCFLDGLTNREIGDVLGISTETVKTHVRNIYSRLGVSDRSSAVAVLRPCLRRSTQPASR